MLVLDEKLIAWAALIGAALFVLGRGGRLECWGYIAVAANWLSMPFVEVRTSWFSPQFGILISDLSLFVILSVMAIITIKLWPIAAAAFELLGSLSRIAALIAPLTLTRDAFYADAVAGYLVLGCLIGGVFVEPDARRSVKDRP